VKFTNSIIASLVLLAASFSMMAQEPSAASSVTLYSSLQDKTGARDCLRFQAETQKEIGCDVRYGSLRIGDEWDWLESSLASDNRSVIGDLGAYEWTGGPKIPWVEPFPKLKPGEQRSFSVDSSGADGKDGAPGVSGRRGADGDGIVRSDPEERIPPANPPSRSKRAAGYKVSPVWVKAIVGHMYVIHVVDETRDFYALFRIDKITRGDNCTISWQPVPAPGK
jgi:hypothetical protein